MHTSKPAASPRLLQDWSVQRTVWPKAGALNSFCGSRPVRSRPVGIVSADSSHRNRPAAPKSLFAKSVRYNHRDQDNRRTGYPSLGCCPDSKKDGITQRGGSKCSPVKTSSAALLLAGGGGGRLFLLGRGRLVRGGEALPLLPAVSGSLGGSQPQRAQAGKRRKKGSEDVSKRSRRVRC